MPAGKLKVRRFRGFWVRIAILGESFGPGVAGGGVLHRVTSDQIACGTSEGVRHSFPALALVFYCRSCPKDLNRDRKQLSKLGPYMGVSSNGSPLVSHSNIPLYSGDLPKVTPVSANIHTSPANLNPKPYTLNPKR